ncbi:hypothetical protein M3Y95_01247100 [Aphelenchoides besseyi]|nr:hypothetical protein M3Y95_01247100 [Aphelenchoides besseyi]
MSYYVHNPYFFANVTNQSFESTTLGRVFIYNQVASSVFGFILIPLVICMILFRSPPSLQHFRKILLVIHLLDLMVWIVATLGGFRTRYVNDIGLHSFVGIMSLLPFDIQMIVHVLLQVFLEAHYTRQIETPIPAVVVRDAQHNFIAFLSLTYDRIMSFVSFLISVLIAWRTYRFLKTQVQDAGRSSKTMDQFTRVIFAQMLIPTLSLFLPMLVIATMVYIGITNNVSQIFMTMLLTWIPSFNSISTLFFIVPYRRVICSKIKRLNVSSVSSVSPIVVTPVNSIR